MLYSIEAAMRFAQLEISNFKALTNFEIEEVGDAVVLAGPNGSGKSCVLDAIRLLKSAYAGYNPNEWHNWMGEFQINFQQRPQDLVGLLQDPGRPLRISGTSLSRSQSSPTSATTPWFS